MVLAEANYYYFNLETERSTSMLNKLLITVIKSIRGLILAFQSQQY